MKKQQIKYHLQITQQQFVKNIIMKSQPIIDLVKTSHGYSIVEKDILMNKPATNAQQSISINQSYAIKSSKQKLPPTTAKKFIPQQNYTIYPYINLKQSDNHKYIIIPSKSQWFNLNMVHEIQKKQLPEWFKLKKGVSASINLIKFEKNQELYKKYRNYIIELGKTQYVTPLMARKGLAGDASSIIRIHNFLQKWGLINFVFQKSNIKKSQQSNQDKNITQISNPTLIKRKDCFQRDKTLLTKNYNKDDFQLLKKITKKFRPICQLCQGICGIVWYEYKSQLNSKKFITNQTTQTKIVQSGDKFQYSIRACYSCYNQKKFPFILNYEDFIRKTLVDSIQMIDLDKKYRRKNVQILKIAEAIQKNKFNIKKSSQILKMQQKELLDTLLQIPIMSLEKISRIQPQTEDENQDLLKNQRKNLSSKSSVSKQKSQKLIEESNEQDQQVKMFKNNLKNIQVQEKKYYQEFLQCWLLKMYSKLQQLGQWDKSIQWKTSQNIQTQKYNIAEKLRKNVKI